MFLEFLCSGVFLVVVVFHISLISSHVFEVYFVSRLAFLTFKYSGFFFFFPFYFFCFNWSHRNCLP